MLLVVLLILLLILLVIGETEKMDGYCYILECIKFSKNSLGKKIFYTGSTCRNPEIRFNEHVRGYNSGWMKRNKIRPRRPIYFEFLPDISLADLMYREKQLKRLLHIKKLELLKNLEDKP